MVVDQLESSKLVDKQTGQRKVAANVVDGQQVKWKAIEAARSTRRRVNRQDRQAGELPGCACCTCESREVMFLPKLTAFARRIGSSLPCSNRPGVPGSSGLPEAPIQLFALPFKIT